MAFTMHPLLKKFEAFLLDDNDMADDYSNLREVSRYEDTSTLVNMADIFATDEALDKQVLVDLLVVGKYVRRGDL
jgi:hypothetical protein